MSFPLCIPRLYQAMQSGKCLESRDWAKEACMSTKYTQAVLRLFHECGLAHIADWRRKASRTAIAVDWVGLWVAGPGEHAAKPSPLDNALVQRNRYKRLKARYGTKRAVQILKPRGRGGITEIVEEGYTTYKRGAPRGRNNQQGVKA